MITIDIIEEWYDAEEAAVSLERVAKLLRDGYWGGTDPSWVLHGEEEKKR